MMLFIFLTFNLLNTKTEQRQISQGMVGSSHTFVGWSYREDVCTKQPEDRGEVSAPFYFV